MQKRPTIVTRLGQSTRPPHRGGEATLPCATSDRALEHAADAVDGKADRALELAAAIGRWLPSPDSGRTAECWRVLSTVATMDLTAAGVVEAHTDALAILAEATADPDVRFDSEPLDEPGADPTDNADDGLPRGSGGDARTWGVFAAEGPGVRVDPRRVAGGWELSGTKPWCSLAGELSNALIIAHTGDGARRLFAIDLSGSGVRVAESGWVAKGLTEVVSGPIDLLDCPARPVGPDGWYLARPGFAWGGIGVAACWFGGAVGVGYCLGPAPLAMDKHHARRVADLELYLRQHHAEGDEAALRRQVLRQPEWPLSRTTGFRTATSRNNHDPNGRR